MRAEYEDSLALSRRMQTNVELFLRQPGAAGLEAVKIAWIQGREPYMQSEVGRFYDGPIDAVEGYINSWPIDENYLDYTQFSPDAGLINQVDKFPAINRDTLLGANEREGDKNVSTGFHAIEFLLWGQDLYADGPGRRSWADYIDSAEGPGRHAARRRQCLAQLAALLPEHLNTVAIAWAPTQSHNYRARLLAMPPEAALSAILTGLGNLSGAELSGERLLVPYTTKHQENEHSCFSDTTHLDLVNNEIGIQNICLGRYRRSDGVVLEGPGLIAVIEPLDAALAATLKSQLEEGVAALKAIPAPFDQAILGNDDARGRMAIKKSLEALQAQTASILKAAELVGVRLNLK